MLNNGNARHGVGFSDFFRFKGYVRLAAIGFLLPKYRRVNCPYNLSYFVFDMSLSFLSINCPLINCLSCLQERHLKTKDQKDQKDQKDKKSNAEREEKYFSLYRMSTRILYHEDKKRQKRQNGRKKDKIDTNGRQKRQKRRGRLAVEDLPIFHEVSERERKENISHPTAILREYCTPKTSKTKSTASIDAAYSEYSVVQYLCHVPEYQVLYQVPGTLPGRGVIVPAGTPSTWYRQIRRSLQRLVGHG